MIQDERLQQRKRIGQRIAEMRRQRGMTQQVLANLTGIRQSHIARIEKGSYSVGFDTLQAIAGAMDMRIDLI